MLQALPRVVLAVALVAACGKKGAPAKKDDAGLGKPPVAPLAMPPLGVDRISRFAFIYGDGAKPYDAIAHSKDPKAVRQGCEAALAKDPQHLDAHRALAGALAEGGEPAEAVDHLVTALAADYYKYAPTLGDADLESFRATSHGQAVAYLAQQLAGEYARRVKNGLLVVGRRSPFRWNDKLGVQSTTSRGELYAYDREGKRFLRLTHTDHQVAAFVRAPSGDEVALLGFDKADREKDDATPPLLAHAWVEIVDTKDWKTIGKRAVLPSAREVSIGYAGDQLLISTAPANGRWGLGAVEVSALDRATGKLTKVGDPPPVPRVVLNLDEGRLVRGVPGIQAAWSNEPPTTTSMKLAGGATIAVPESGQAQQASVAVAPDGAHVAFATAVDPCAKDAAPSLYVGDARSGALKHVLTARSRFATRWLDAQTLAYEDGDGAIRLWDAATQRQAERLAERGGLALDVLSIANAPLCKQAPPAVETGSGSGAGEEPMPPEEKEP